MVKVNEFYIVYQKSSHLTLNLTHWLNYMEWKIIGSCLLLSFTHTKSKALTILLASSLLC